MFPHIAYVFIVNIFVISLVILIHYEFLYYLSKFGRLVKIHYRYHVLISVFGSIIAHAIEVWIFAIAFYIMHHTEGWGELNGGGAMNILDCVYFSFTTFSTLGYGDIVPNGSIRYLVGLEALTGLVLIAWTSSFLFMGMYQYWSANEADDRNHNE